MIRGFFLYKEILNKKTVLRKGMMYYGKKEINASIAIQVLPNVVGNKEFEFAL